LLRRELLLLLRKLLLRWLLLRLPEAVLRAHRQRRH
jgi:hypothetical protein